MRRPRMTTRRWMIAVAVVALLMGGSVYRIRMARLSDRYSQAASAFRRAEKAFSGSGWRNEGRRRAWAELFRRVAEKYEHASRYPWLPLDLDPPLPQP